MTRKYKYFLYVIAAILLAEGLSIYINRDQFNFGSWGEITSSPAPVVVEDDPYVDLLNQGNTYITDDNIASATKSFDDAIALDPERPDAYTFKSSLATSTDERMRLLNLSIAKDPDYGYAYDFRADIYFNQRKFRLSLADGEKALKTGEFTYKTYQYMTSDYLNLHDYVDALDSSQEVLRMEPDDTEAMLMEGFALYNLGVCQDASDLFDQAVEMSRGGEEEVEMRDSFIDEFDPNSCVDGSQDSGQDQSSPTSTPMEGPDYGTGV